MNPLFQKIRLESDITELNPLREPDRKAVLTVYGISRDGTEEEIAPQQIRFSITTLLTNGDQEAAAVSKDGIVTVMESDSYTYTRQ